MCSDKSLSVHAGVFFSSNRCAFVNPFALLAVCRCTPGALLFAPESMCDCDILSHIVLYRIANFRTGPAHRFPAQPPRKAPPGFLFLSPGVLILRKAGGAPDGKFRKEYPHKKNVPPMGRRFSCVSGCLAFLFHTIRVLALSSFWQEDCFHLLLFFPPIIHALRVEGDRRSRRER